MNVERKLVRWVGSSRRDLKEFPRAVQQEYPSVKALKGLGGRSVLEIVADHKTDTWRAVYTARFGNFLYVLHAFQKKSKTGIATPQKDIDLIRQRLTAAERDYRERQN